MDPSAIRRKFLRGLFAELRVVWPILSVLLALMVGLGLTIGWREGWSIEEAVFFTFVSGLTIGYGDLVPRFPLTRALAIAIGLCGVLLTALLAAVAVQALASATGDREK
jgi:hypothetical protein